ncbi:hypothetical protein ADL15_43520 [Actinoplanes awajinensis subsp. mycoplanecinus]|uniref:Uncharacterized protein n=1 Tax=Actinoplanes awajinensis subsp. mycoplanecinus TaxID=135947 RepID=A0A101JCQ9_9ACTN|nr:hypothetical protein ADL15_43520 [Actinoplanes awajinensis subsp. mycoplanecinus]
MLGVVLAALTLIAVAAAIAGRLGVSRAVVTATARAVVQLGLVSLLIAAVLRSWWSTAGFIVLMVLVAAVTSARRVSTLRLGWLVIVASGTVPRSEVAVLPIAGILIGGGSAVQAGATQLLVLVGLLAAEAIAAAVTLELVAGSLVGRLSPR